MGQFAPLWQGKNERQDCIVPLLEVTSFVSPMTDLGLDMTRWAAQSVRQHAATWITTVWWQHPPGQEFPVLRQGNRIWIASD